MVLVNILIPCFRAELFIERTIASVQAQTIIDWKIVVVDDGSPDESADLVMRMAERDSRIRLVRQTNAGVSRARNCAFAHSDPSANYLLFLDADDTLNPTMLETLVRHLANNSEATMVYCEPNRIDADDHPCASSASDLLGTRRWTTDNRSIKRIPDGSPSTPFHSVFAWNGIIPSVALIRRTDYAATPGFDEEFGHLFEDTDLFFALALRGPVHYLPNKLVNYRIHVGQASNRQSALWHQERKLYRKWLSSVAVRNSEEGRLIHSAWEFRELRLMPRLNLRWAIESARSRKPLAAAKHVLRCIKHLMTYYYGRHLLAQSAKRHA